jgi:hypothetical protein
MNGTAWLARRWLARRWPATVLVAVIVAAGVACSMVALAASERTSNAYTDYVERADVGDVVINPSFGSREIAEVIGGLPGVQRMTTSVLLTASLEESGPIRRPPPEVTDVVDETAMFVLGSVDGRYFDMDRPVVQSGRMPTFAGEAVITPETSAAHDLGVGDVVPMTFWQFGVPIGLDEEQLAARENEIVAPLGVEHVTIVGVVTLADEALPEQLYPRQRMIVSPDITDKYGCLPPEPPQGLTLAENVEILVPDDCAVAQTYFSLDLAQGADGVKGALDEYLRLTSERNVVLRDGITDLAEFEGQEPQYNLIPTETRVDIERVDDAVRPTVAALLVLGLVAAVLTVALAGLVVWRESQRTVGDQLQWHHLGVSSTARATVVALPMIAGIAAGVAVAVPSAWLFDVGPQGLVAKMEPDPARRLLMPAVLAAVVIGVVTVALTCGLTWWITRRAQRSLLTSDHRRAGRGIGWRLGGPVVTEGVRAAYRRRSGIPLIGGLSIAVATLVAALTFGSSLSALVSTPASFGWPWDLAAATNAGYGNLDIEGAQRLLDDDPDVEAWGYYGFISAIAVNGEPMAALIDPVVGSGSDVTVVEGSLPVTADEVALAVTTASERGLDVGDTVELGGLVRPPRTATVTARVVLPTLGPFESDRVSAGSGMLVPFALFEEPELEFVRDFVASWYAYVGVELVDGADRDAAIVRLEPLIGGLELTGIPANTYSRPVRPVEIVDAEATRSMPRAFGLAFAAVGAIGLAVASWASARARRRELAILQSLGLDAGQTRGTVVVQSIATVAAALVLGVPIGVVAGRSSWRAFAGELGVVPDPTTPLTVVVSVVLGGLVVAVLAALVPSLQAGKVLPAAGLRSE